MGYLVAPPPPWQRERQLTCVLEAVALVIQAITASAGVTLPALEFRTPPAFASLRSHGRDQRWRGAHVPVVVALEV